MEETTIYLGCSFTEGTGFDFNKKDPNLWVNILHSTNSHLSKTVLVNQGHGGCSNEHIFKTAAKSLFDYKPKYALVQWTNYPRYTVLLGLETYSAVQNFTGGPCRDHTLHNISYTADYLNNIKDRFLSLHHPHQGILNIVEYTNLLKNIANTVNTKIFFINGLGHWDQNYFDLLINASPNDFTPFTREILNCATRDDADIHDIYFRIHLDYTRAGGIQANQWLNLYNSMKSSQIDFNNDGLHPGILSNQQYAKTFSDKLNQYLGS